MAEVTLTDSAHGLIHISHDSTKDEDSRHRTDISQLRVMCKHESGNLLGMSATQVDLNQVLETSKPDA